MIRPAVRERLALAALLAVLAAQSVGSMTRLSATSDETSHLPSGYTYLVTGDLRLNPQHPPLIKELCALPLLAIAPRMDTDDPGWRRETLDEWGFGYRFLYANDADRLLFWGRLPVVLLTLVMAATVFRWAREMFSAPAAWLALGLCAFSPNVIAHSHLVTMDSGLACFTLLTLYFAWRFVRGGRRRDAVLAGLALGLGLAAKFSAVVLVPVLAVLLALAAWLGPGPAGGPRAGPDSVRRRSVRMAVAFAGMVVLAGFVVWAAYLFPADPGFYLRGLEQVNVDHDPDYAYYLAGEFRTGGFWNYFLVAFLVKTPLPTLMLLVLAVACIRRRPAGSFLDEAFLAVPVVAFTVATSLFADNLGVRYLLPVYPLLFVFAGRVAPVLAGSRTGRTAAVVLAAWYVGSAAFIYPNHLAFFNEAAGGPGRGHRWLDDSNIDWGEGLVQLADWARRENADRIRLLYGWNGSPLHYGIPAEPVSNEQWASERPPPGLYAVSTHLLVRGEYHARRLGVPTNWMTLYEPVDRVGYGFYVFRFEEAQARYEPVSDSRRSTPTGTRAGAEAPARRAAAFLRRRANSEMATWCPRKPTR